MKFKRAILMVLDSVGIGAMSDTKDYNDPEWVNTLANTAKACGGLNLPNLEDLGLGRLGDFQGIASKVPSHGIARRFKEQSTGKDTTTGHWEIAGHVVTEPFAYFPEGFPPQILGPLLREHNLDGCLGNEPASGTEIIERFGDAHKRSGLPIIYTSGDSVLQIAAHEETFGLEQLYKMCATARRICTPFKIARVIARPFIDNPDGPGFVRTENRKDYSLPLPAKMLFEHLQDHGIETFAIGKIASIYNDAGVKEIFKSKDNNEGIDQLLKLLDDKKRNGLFAINLVDFDQEYGHRRNPKGYGKALEKFDERLPEVLQRIDKDTLLLLTADHGNDPTAPGTDHTREHVPMILYSPSLGSDPVADGELTVTGFQHMGATLFAVLTDEPPPFGRSLLDFQ